MHASWMVAAFEISGVVGMLLGGWLTDRVFGGRGARACLVYMALASLSVFIFWKLPAHSNGLSTVTLCAAGFFICGPQALIAIIVANLATKRAAATAAGFTGIFGYASTLPSGWGLGWLVQARGWDAGFLALVGMGASARCCSPPRGKRRPTATGDSPTEVRQRRTPTPIRRAGPC